MLHHSMNEAWKYQGAQHNKEQHIGDLQQYSNIRHSNGRIIERIENTAQFCFLFSAHIKCRAAWWLFLA
jgi:hypothetical protein